MGPHDPADPFVHEREPGTRAVQRPRAMRGRPWLAFRVVTVGALIALICVWSPQFARNSSSAVCNHSRTLEERNHAEFWTYKSSNNASIIVVQPADPLVSAAACQSLAAASFLVSAQFDQTNVLLTRLPSSEPAGTYHYMLPRVKYVHESRIAKIEARLEFGYLPAEHQGQPCADAVCRPDTVYALGMVYNGTELSSSDGSQVTLHSESSAEQAWTDSPPTRVGSISPALPLCDVSSQLVVEVDRSQGTPYFYDPSNGLPCRLRAFTEIPSSGGNSRWIHVLGDSNSRFLVPAWAKSIKLATCHAHTADESARPTTYVCYDESGRSNVVLSFSWFFLSHSSDDSQVLAATDLSSLANFIASVPFPAATIWPRHFGEDIRMASLFISWGSHAPFLTYKSVRERLDKVQDELSIKMRQAGHSYILSTLAVAETMIPDRWGNQSSLRNNVMIDVQNQASEDWIGHNFPSVQSVDFFNYTRVLPLTLRQDAVHFRAQIYTNLAQIAWTAEATGR